MARIEQSIEVNVPLSAAYNQWTQFEQYPRFMDGVREVRQLDDAHLHWRAHRHGREVEWDSEITDQVPDDHIAWRDVSGPGHAGSIRFEPIEHGRTRVRMKMDFDPTPESSNAQELSERVGQDLERFKHLVEAQGHESGAWRGEIHGARRVQVEDRSNFTGETAGKTVGQGQREQQEASTSGAGSSAQAHPHWEDWNDESAFGSKTASGDANRNAGAGSGNAAEGAGAGQNAQQRTGNDHGNHGYGSDRSSQTGASSSDSWSGNARSGAAWLRNQFSNLEEPVRRMTEEMDQLFERFIGRPIAGRFGQGGMAGKWMPQVEIVQGENELIVCTDVPGVKRENIQIQVQHDRLTIEGERHEESQSRTREGYRRSERSYGRFYRMIPLPHGVDPDNVRASLQEGVLEVHIPMPAVARQARRVDIG